jgi:hypothetical protein
MPQTIRHHWSPRKGRQVLNVNWSAISANSVVLITASEYAPNGPEDSDGSAQRWCGDANIRVANVTPHGPPSDANRGVTFVVEIDWADPLPIVTDITLLDAPPIDVEYVGNAPH